MKRLDVSIDKYSWHLVIFVGVGISNIKRIIKYLHFLYCDDSYESNAVKSIVSGENNAITITNMIIKRSFVIINKTSNDKEFVNSVVHECRHVQSHIATKYNLDEKGEDVAYLLGYIVAEIYNKISNSSK